MQREPIMSVSGIRGRMGESITPVLFSQMAYLQCRRAGGGRIVIGRDTRGSGAELARAAFRGVHCAGGSPVDIGIAPTPTTVFATRHLAASAGIVITASHNPLPYNGYKAVHASGRLYNAAECEGLYEAYRSGKIPDEAALAGSLDTPDQMVEASLSHVEAILDVVDAALINRTGISVAVDSINGAAGAVFPQLLDRLGVKWTGVHNELNGNFVHNPEPRPEHLGDLSAVLASRDDLWAGFAFDPDADRLATMGGHGEAVSEELTLALALDNVLARESTSVATNLSTSMIVDDVASSHGATVYRTKIGEANVVECMREHGCAVGGEGNGGVIYPRVACVRDGLTAMALIIELMARTGKRLTDLTSALPQYCIVKRTLPLAGRNATRTIDHLADVFGKENLDTQDGLKIIRDNGWVHIRPSNTEPILRCYAEAPTANEASALADMVTSQLES